jgi:hypothetical protein
MKHDAHQLNVPVRNALGKVATHRALDRSADTDVHGPVVLTHGDGRVLFGPGIDDFNAFDDPC